MNVQHGNTPPRLGSEHGLALPAALIFLFVIMTLGTVVAATAMTGTHQAGRDRSVKRAIAAADAGLAAAIYRVNKLAPKSLECVVEGSTGLVIEGAQADGWCRAQSEDLGDGASFTYRVRAAQQVTVNGQRLLQRKIVSTGNVIGVKRRAAAVVGSSTGISLFGGYAVITLNDMTLPNSTQIQGNLGSNGNIAVVNNATLCGHATFGPGKQFSTQNSGSQCSGFVRTAADEPFVLNPVDPGNAATENNNSFIGTVDTWTNPSKIVWSPYSRVLELQNSASLTLTGDVYSFCRLEIDNNSQLIIAPRASGRPPLKIYIDDPANCGSGPGMGSVRLRNGGTITNLNSDPTTVQLYALGTSTSTTSIDFDNNFETQVNVLIYAPQSTVSFTNHTHIVGAVAAKNVLMQSNTAVIWDQRADDVTVNNLLPLYQRQSYVECTTTTSGSAPDSGC